MHLCAKSGADILLSLILLKVHGKRGILKPNCEILNDTKICKFVDRHRRAEDIYAPYVGCRILFTETKKTGNSNTNISERDSKIGLDKSSHVGQTSLAMKRN